MEKVIEFHFHCIIHVQVLVLSFSRMKEKVEKVRGVGNIYFLRFKQILSHPLCSFFSGYSFGLFPFFVFLLIETLYQIFFFYIVNLIPFEKATWVFALETSEFLSHVYVSGFMWSYFISFVILLFLSNIIG